jgi:predicted Fe-S protein YdhL (DUF1289 family)
MNEETASLWVQMTDEQRQQVIALLAQILLRQIMEQSGEVGDEGGE